MSASKNVPRIVPWLSAEEWRETRQLLYSPEVEEIKQGLLQAKIWVDRGKVPTAVESTINFLEIILTDRVHLKEFLYSRVKQDEDKISLEEEEEEVIKSDDRQLRLAYTAAVIRFVNELVDRAQKSLFATSITKLADQVGLPRVFVDIRHDGTHDKLSSLELLRWAAGEAVKWLEDQYWSFEDDSTPITWQSDFKANLFGLLDAYCEQLEKISEAQPASALEKSSISRIISQIDFLQTLPRITREFLSCLCEYRRPESSLKQSENVVESLVRPLFRSSPDIFFQAFLEIVLDRSESDCWFPWIREEVQKSGEFQIADYFVAEVLEKFAGKSSETLFNTRIVKIWDHFGSICVNEKPKKVYSVFERVYSVNSEMKNNNNSGQKAAVSSSVTKSRALLQKRQYVEYEDLEGWSEVCENWQPCPLGSTPATNEKSVK